VAERTEPQQRAFLRVVEGLLAEEDAAYARYRRTQHDAKHRLAAPPRPLEYDESGFPLPQQRPGFAQRVARILNA
jgi:hypothetical protein